MTKVPEFNTIYDFWFKELKPEDWWKKSDELDNTIKDRFLNLHSQAMKGELFSWRKTAKGRLTEIILLDQFSRNMFRNKPESFASDSTALILTQEAINVGADKELETTQEKHFLYMPLMHSESQLIHEIALKIFTDLGSPDFEIKHKVIIDRFGRYPHRNKILDRKSTPEEEAFLKEPGSSF